MSETKQVPEHLNAEERKDWEFAHCGSIDILPSSRGIMLRNLQTISELRGYLKFYMQPHKDCQCATCREARKLLEQAEEGKG